MTEVEMKKWIDEASYEDLLKKWRFAPSGDPFFIGETGKYYKKVFQDRRNKVGAATHVAASKAIG